jgi:predicted phage terminase large subunit-like protein
MTRGELAALVLKRRHIRADFGAWCEHVLEPLGQRPAKHHRLIIRELQDVGRGENDRLMLFLPPGSAKSTYASILFPAWFLAQAPNQTMIGASHTSTLAEDFSRRIHATIRDHTHTIGYGLERESAELWTTTNGGRYRAAGVGVPIAGTRADCALIDDPVKSWADADSERRREVIWDWFRADLLTRLRPGGRIVLIQTRWRQDDLAGRLLASERDRWRVVSLPALAETDDPIGREPGQPLWPEWETGDMLADKRRTLGERGWAALFQQRPTQADGAIIKSTWWQPWTEDLPKPDMTIVSLDTAYTEDNQNDPSACTVWDIVSGDLTAKIPDFRSRPILVHAWSKRLEFPALIEKLDETVKNAKVKGVPLRVLIEGKASGISVEQELRRRRPDLNIFRINPRRYGDKVARAHAVTAMFEAGVVHAVADKKRGFEPFAEQVIAECAAFPLGTHDDLVDTVTQALRHIRDLGLEFFAEDAAPPARHKEPAPLY